MYIRIKSLQYQCQEIYDEQLELHVYSNSPVGPREFVVLRYPFKEAAIIPTTNAATTLRIELYSLTNAEDGQMVLNHSGKATVSMDGMPFKKCRSYDKVSLTCHENKDERHALVDFEVGPAFASPLAPWQPTMLLHNAIPDKNQNVRPARCIKTDASGDMVIKQAAGWLLNGFAVIVPELADIHIAQMKDHTPGFAYALVKPSRPEPEEYLIRVIEIAYGRLQAANETGFTQQGGLLLMAQQAIADNPTAMCSFSLLVAYALQFVANAYPYLEDRCGRVMIERFSSNLRITGGDDCEGLAKEILMLADSIRNHNASVNKLVMAANKVCKCFTIALQLGAVTFHRLNGEVYKQGTTAAGDPSDYFAHAYIVLIPNSIMTRTLGPTVILDQQAIVHTPGTALLQSMAIDGTNIKHPLPMTQSMANTRTGPTQWYTNIASSIQRRMKRTQFVEDNFYQYAFSNLVMSGLCSKENPDLQVFELYYISNDFNDFNQLRNVRGASFSKAMCCNADQQSVIMNACYVPSKKQINDIQATLAMEEHPIPPHTCRTDGTMKKHMQARLEAVIQALNRANVPVTLNPTPDEYGSAGKLAQHQVYVTMYDITDEAFIHAMIANCPNQLAGVMIDVYSDSLVSGTIMLK